MSQQVIKNLSNYLYPSESIHQEELEKFFVGGCANNSFEPPQTDLAGTEIVMCFTNRCGSNLLAHGLHLTESLPIMSEMLNFDEVIRICRRNQISSFYEYLYKLRDHNMHNYSAFGIKVACSQLFHLAKIGAIPNIIKNPKFIVISRQNKIAQAVSLYIATQTKVWAKTSNQTPKVNVNYDFESILQGLHQIVQNTAFFDYFFSVHGIEPIRVIYEELLNSYTDEVSRVVEALGVKPKSIPALEDVSIKKQANQLNTDFINRFKTDMKW